MPGDDPDGHGDDDVERLCSGGAVHSAMQLTPALRCRCGGDGCRVWTRWLGGARATDAGPQCGLVGANLGALIARSVTSIGILVQQRPSPPEHPHEASGRSGHNSGCSLRGWIRNGTVPQRCGRSASSARKLVHTRLAPVCGGGCRAWRHWSEAACAAVVSILADDAPFSRALIGPAGEPGMTAITLQWPPPPVDPSLDVGLAGRDVAQPMQILARYRRPRGGLDGWAPRGCQPDGHSDGDSSAKFLGHLGVQLDGRDHHCFRMCAGNPSHPSPAAVRRGRTKLESECQEDTVVLYLHPRPVRSLGRKPHGPYRRAAAASRTWDLPGGWFPLRFGLLAFGSWIHGGDVIRPMIGAGAKLAPGGRRRDPDNAGAARWKYRHTLGMGGMRHWGAILRKTGWYTAGAAGCASSDSATRVGRIVVIAEARRVARTRYPWARHRAPAAGIVQGGSRGRVAVRRLRVLDATDFDTPADTGLSDHPAWIWSPAGDEVADATSDAPSARRRQQTRVLTPDDDGTLGRPALSFSLLPWTWTFLSACVYPPSTLHHGAPPWCRCPPPRDDPPWTDGWRERIANKRKCREEQELARARVFIFSPIVSMNENEGASRKRVHGKGGQEGGRICHRHRITTTRRRDGMQVSDDHCGDGLDGDGCRCDGGDAEVMPMPAPPRDPTEGRRERRQRAHVHEPQQTGTPHSGAGRTRGKRRAGFTRHWNGERNPITVPLSSAPTPTTRASQPHALHLPPPSLATPRRQGGLSEPRGQATLGLQAGAVPTSPHSPPSPPCPPAWAAAERRPDIAEECVFEGTGRAAAAEPERINISIIITNVIAEGPLGLRGGGPRPPPGAGVYDWLEDEEAVEARERAEMDARRWEEVLLGRDGRDEAADLEEAVPMTTSMADAGGRPMRITGEIHGRPTTICGSCYKDCYEGFAVDCKCGRARCSSCWAAGPCTCGETCGSAAVPNSLSSHAPVPISIFDALGLEHLDPVLDGRPALRDLRGRGIENMIDDDMSNPEAIDCPPDMGVQPALTCVGCGTSSLEVSWGWVLCRCGAYLCAGCGPVHRAQCERMEDVPAVAVHPIDIDDVDEADDLDVQAAHEDNLLESGAGAMHDTMKPSRWRLTPAQAAARRENIIEESERRLRDRRAASRGVEKLQCREGRRPPRQGGRKGDVILVSANVGGAGPLQTELQHGSLFASADFVAVQEHKLHGEVKGAAEKRIAGADWDCILDEPYYKRSDYGGGTGILASRWSGVRPTAWNAREFGSASKDLQGRGSAGVIDLFGGVLFMSFYGISGLPPSKQLHLWLAIAKVVSLLGLPFVIGGDWQCTPEELARSGVLRAIGGSIAAPTAPTNTVSGRVIDFFVVADSISRFVRTVEVSCEAAFTPHLPVVLRLRCPRALGATTRVVQPRIFSAEHPAQTTADSGLDSSGHDGLYDVDWEEWVMNPPESGRGVGDKTISEWFAGASLELSNIFGIQGTVDEPHYAGIGRGVRTVQAAAGPRRRGAPDASGLLGHRLSWASRYLHIVIMWWSPRGHDAGDEADLRRRTAAQRLVLAASFRAEAFLREAVVQQPQKEDVADACVLWSALTALARVRLHVDGRGKLAHIFGWPEEVPDDLLMSFLDHYKKVEHSLAVASATLAARRRRQCLRRMAAWAKSAPLKLAHAATKSVDYVSSYSASASKTHMGEATAQGAADLGIKEWGKFWKAGARDHGEDALQLLETIVREGPSEFLTPEDGRLTELDLPPIDERRIWRSARAFRGSTGIALDWLRPRHVAWLSRGARAALARVLNEIEKAGRWPGILREVLAVALPKKGGGARLIGLLISIYRIWARLRYADIREALEARLARHFLSAAPGEGAQRAAGSASLFAEAAVARGEQAATTLADVQKFYEQVEHREMLEGAVAFGVPKPILALAVHQYTAPRRIRVRNAFSEPVFPERSIVAGCTWATVLIRTLVIGPCERLLRAIKARCEGWEVRSALNVFVDDLALSTAGSVHTVAMLHAWASRLLTGWVTRRMKKKLALDKLVCVASSASTRSALRASLEEIGCTVSAGADFLGTDYSAGGVIRRRGLLRKRLGKALQRKKKIRWWRKLGGCAREVARGGIQPSVSYGASASGLPPKAQLARRRLQAAASRIGAAGSSLTSKLAIGGSNFSDVDPTVLDPNPPMALLLQLLWDRPRLRSEFLDCWHYMSQELAGLSPEKTWSRVRGIVSAAWAHLRQIGGEWTSPFCLKLVDEQVDILITSPKHVMEVMAHHARVSLDRKLILRIAVCNGFNDDDIEMTMSMYRNGIDWKAIRKALINRDRVLSAVECKALELVVTQALWPEGRRWRAGLLGHGTCMACLDEVATQPHRIRLCEGVRQHLGLQRRAGRLGRNLAREQVILDLPLPLLHFGLPPRQWKWQPRSGRRAEGCLQPGRVGTFFGDGSGYAQDSIDERQSTWAVALEDRACNVSASSPGSSYRRGAIQGWHPTVPRGEVTAIIRFLDLAGVGSEYVGDCKYALDVIQAGVPPKFRSSGCADADLWRVAARALSQKGGSSSFTFTKVKAHRGRAQAESEGELAVRHWEGNSRADSLAKSLARDVVSERDRVAACEGVPFPGGIGALLRETAMGAAWAIQHWPEVGKRAKQRRNDKSSGGSAASSEVGPHSLVPREGGGWHCADCLLITRTQASRKSLRTTPCRGSVTTQCHASHELRWTHGVFWCWACGRYTVKRPRALKLPCPGTPASAAARNVLRRLREGRPPTTASYLYDVAQVAGSFPRATAGGARVQRDGRAGPRREDGDNDLPAAADREVARVEGAAARGSNDVAAPLSGQSASELQGSRMECPRDSVVSPPSARRRLLGKQSANRDADDHADEAGARADDAEFNVGGTLPSASGSRENGRCELKMADRAIGKGQSSLRAPHDGHHPRLVDHHRHLAAAVEPPPPSSSARGGVDGEDQPSQSALIDDHHLRRVAHHRLPAAAVEPPPPSSSARGGVDSDPRSGSYRHPCQAAPRACDDWLSGQRPAGVAPPAAHHHHRIDLNRHRATPVEQEGSEVKSVESVLCRPGESTPWTSRVAISALSIATDCSVCSTPSRVACRGCNRQLCLRCARERKWCPSILDATAPAAVAVAGAVRSVLPSSRVLASAVARAADDEDQDEGTTS